MTPEIKTIEAKILVGKKLKMTFANDRTGELWRSFMPRRKEITNNRSTDLFSVKVFDQVPDFANFTLDISFDKWAAVEVTNAEYIPPGMGSLTLPGGLYAIFHYKGLNTDDAIFRYIYTTWLPASGYVLDNRPHFEILGDKYKNGSPDSEEEIYIPIKLV